MGEWVPKEQWEAQQVERKNKQQAKIPLIISPDLKKIINPATQKDIIESFLTCICHGVKNLYGISKGIIKLRCTSCGMEYGYCEDHYYFNLKKSPEQSALATSDCTCSKCHVPIEAAQAKSSLGFVGKELCKECMGQELG